MIMKHEFVEYVPEVLSEGTVYISVRFATVVHNCACGCGGETVTPLSPTDWYLTFDGKSVSLYPSIGNWSLDCKSHYWIKNNEVIWADRWSDAEIKTGRAYDSSVKTRYYSQTDSSGSEVAVSQAVTGKVESSESWWARLKEWLRKN